MYSENTTDFPLVCFLLLF